MESIGIALLGMGTVGSGVIDLLQKNKARFATLVGRKLDIVGVAVRDLSKTRQDLPPGITPTTNATELIQSPAVSIVVELIGGVETPRALLRQAIQAGKLVVTANKALLAEHGDELFALAADKGVSIAFEAAVAGGIPIIANLCQCLAANRIEAVEAILNGTSNFILSQMERQGWSYAQALAEAQRLGFAEADPTLDVNGSDAVQKLAVLAKLAFGARTHWKAISCVGIDGIQAADQRFAQELGYRIKLIATAKRRGSTLEMHVAPTLVRRGSPLGEVSDAYNAVRVEGDAVGDLFYQGRGAGRFPTASAVVADILDTALGRAAITFRGVAAASRTVETLEVGDSSEIVGRYYLRFDACDRPGVLAEIAGELGKQAISIASVIQHDSETSAGGVAPLVIMTHETTQGAVETALLDIAKLNVVQGECVSMRVMP